MAAITVAELSVHERLDLMVQRLDALTARFDRVEAVVAEAGTTCQELASAHVRLRAEAEECCMELSRAVEGCAEEIRRIGQIVESEAA